MPSTDVYSLKNKKQGKVDLQEAIFGVKEKTLPLA